MQAQNIDPNLLKLKPSFLSSYTEFSLFIAGWAFSGIGIIGQPQVMSKVITLKNESHINKTRNYYFFWNYLLISSVFIIGIASRVILGTHIKDNEFAYLSLAKELLPLNLSLIVFSGLLSAILSTLDSMLLSVTSIISNDILKKDTTNIRVVVIFCIILVSLFISFSSLSVFSLVMTAWPALAAILSPLVALRCLDPDFLSKYGYTILVISVLGFSFSKIIEVEFLNEVTISFMITFVYYLIVKKKYKI